ncbi:MAG TPA: heparan-alpha-glucosaminide N-acetyltransferase domain-containing protein [Luteolibacter sp.]|nr:heparan-alpha-glucosaminide N-acetyltransferase domain-containing protein [Luteolibacter sp.]
MSESPEPHTPKPRRLMFIDLARAVAILMMLQGHFIDMTLADAYRHNPFHTFWQHFRGLAAPMFFASTGLIFVYLLSGNATGPFFSLTRVRKGFVRSAELLFWGYLLQINLLRLPEYFRTGPDHWLTAFHVLQCIAVGILLLMGVFAVHRLLPKIPLPFWYVAAGLGLSLGHVVLFNLPGGSWFPRGAPEVIQNIFKGPLSIFPITPWLIFTMYGAALGAWVRLDPEKVRTFGPWLILAGFALKYSGVFIDRGIALLAGAISGNRLAPEHWIHDRCGEILAALGLLIFIDRRFKLRDSWFLEIGRNTLAVYVVHVVLLYNGFFGIGLRTWWEKALNPWQAAIGAVVFMAGFGVFAVWVGKFTNWRKAGNRMSPT